MIGQIKIYKCALNDIEIKTEFKSGADIFKNETNE